MAASLALSACATTSPSDGSSGTSPSLFGGGGGQRDLTAQEKKVIIDALAPSLRDAAAAKYRWAKFPTSVPLSGSVNYCAIVDAKSPFAAYSGRQAFIVEAKVTGGQITSAVVGLIAGGKDFEVVRRMCSKYGLDPNNAT